MAVGDVVLIIDYSQPRDKWLLGRVVTVHRGQDGLVRSAALRTKEGTCVRPVAKGACWKGPGRRRRCGGDDKRCRDKDPEEYDRDNGRVPVASGETHTLE